MKSIQYYAPQDIRYEEVPVKPPEEGEVVVKVMSALTCGTDVKTFRRGHPVLITANQKQEDTEMSPATVVMALVNVLGATMELVILSRRMYALIVYRNILVCAKLVKEKERSMA